MADLTVSANVDSLLSAADYAAMRILLLQGQSLTGSEATSLLDMTSTWNTTGTPTALKLDVTDTASNASSLLMDLQVGGVSKVKVAKDGKTTVAEDIVMDNTRAIFNYNILQIGGTSRSASAGIAVVTNKLRIPGTITFGSSIYSGAGVQLTSDQSTLLSQLNGTTAQEFRIYNTYTDASNGEWLEMGFQDTSNTAVIKTNANGTGTVRNLELVAASQVALRVGGALQHRFNITDYTLGDGVNILLSAGYVKSGTYTVATLPAAATAGAGATAFVSDGSVVHAGNSGSIVAGSGANFVPVYSDGTDWRIT